MHKNRLLPLLGLIFLTAPVYPGNKEFKSGLQPKENIPSAFEPVNITGEHAGEPHCLVCENGLNPVAMVFAREVSEPLIRLIAKLDAASAENRKQELGSFVVFLSDKKDLVTKLKTVAFQNKLKHIVLSIDEPSGPEDYKVHKNADVTVVLYREHVVQANHAFRKGELTDKAIDKIVADLPKILPSKK